MGKKGHDFQQKCGDFFRHGSHDAVVFTLMKVKLAMVGAKEKIPQESPTTLKKKKNISQSFQYTFGISSKPLTYTLPG